MEVFGLDTRRSTMRVRRLIGYVPQQLSIDGQLTGHENAWLLARLYDVPRRERRERVEAALAQVGLEKVADRLASTYSGGMVRRLELAQALVSRPRLLVLDEPTIGLDPLARDSIWERVLGLRADENMTVLLTTHYMEEAEQLCDRVGLLLNGRLQAIGRPRELEAALGPGATDVFRAYASDGADEDKGGRRDVRSTRRTAGRLG
jgi:ABC-2 type transport system ATP-binding protein